MTEMEQHIYEKERLQTLLTATRRELRVTQTLLDITQKKLRLYTKGKDPLSRHK
tara:strand:- start:1266 stop:1427 length:162 start_codon:yes stop_codon:yes gene_type:complete